LQLPHVKARGADHDVHARLHARRHVGKHHVGLREVDGDVGAVQRLA